MITYDIPVATELLPAISRIVSETETRLRIICSTDVRVRLEFDRKILSDDMLALIVCEYLNISWPQITSGIRKREIVIARHLYCYLSRYVLGNTITKIARKIGVDHTTVIHASTTIQNLLDAKDESVTNAYEAIYKRVKDVVL